MEPYSVMGTSQWEEIDHILLECGNACNPKALVMDFLTQLENICFYDKALALFLDGNGKICGQYLHHIEAKFVNAYLDYYAHTEQQQYSCFRDIHENPSRIALHIHNWNEEASSEFLREYIRPLGISYSCGFALYDLNGKVRSIVAIDWLQGNSFSQRDIGFLKVLIPHLNNLHKNFYYQGFHLHAIKKSTLQIANLTERETQIVNLLCQGISQANISRTLHISRSTTYSHIAHIYEKLQISSQQELLSLVLHKTEI